ncbi:MAG TPA: YdbH domain-containing protein [Sandaracinaceae bacterium LLY-WYZ-13_1]|nr:YdbH domain-containing protein [Sandaracinaceae bacterium LLY-WYZ-13_1]
MGLAALVVLAMGTRSAVRAHAERRVRDELAALGFEDASFELEAVGLESLVLRDVVLAPGLRARRVAVGYAPDDLLAGRVDRLAIDGLRWRVPDAAAWERSAAARLFEGDGGAAIPRRIRLRDARARLGGHPLRLDGAYRAARSPDASGRGRLTVRSARGRYALTLRHRRAPGATVVSLRIEGARDRGAVRLRLGDDGAGHMSWDGRIGGLEATVRDARLDARALRLEGRAAWTRARVDALDLWAALAGARVRHPMTGAVTVPRVDLRARRDADRLRWRMTADGPLHVDVRGKLPREVSRWPDGPRVVAWEARGRLPSGALDTRAAVAGDGPDLSSAVRSEAHPVRGERAENVHGASRDAAERERGCVSLASAGTVRVEAGRLRGEGALEASAGAVAVRGATLRDARLSLRLRAAPSDAGPEGDGALTLVAGSAAIDDAEAADLRVAVRGRVADGALRLADGSELRAATARRGTLSGRALVASLAGAIRRDDGAWRWREGRLDLRASDVAVGAGAERLVLADVEGHLTPLDGRALLARRGEATHLAGYLEGTARRLDGAVEGRRLRVDGPLSLALASGGVEGTGRIEASAARLREPDGWLRLDGARVRLPLRWRDGGVFGHGRVQARALAVRDHRLGAADGAVALAPGGGSLRLGCALADGVTGDLALTFDARGGRLAVDVPRHALRPSLTALLHELLGVRITGRAGGGLDAPLDDFGHGTARLTLGGATMAGDRGRVEGAWGRVELASLSPLASAGDARLSWRGLHAAGFALGGRGTARLRIEPSGAIAVSRFTQHVAGGRVALAPFRVDADTDALRLRARARDLALGRILEETTGGRASGEGRLDGALQVTWRREAGSLAFGPGRLRARGPGHFHVGDPAMLATVGDWARGLSGSMIVRRVLGALADFDYRRLELDLASPRADDRLTARLAGAGRTVGQEVDLTLRVRGLRTAVRRILDEGASP